MVTAPAKLSTSNATQTKITLPQVRTPIMILLFAAGCQPNTILTPFVLTDVNENSSTYQQKISTEAYQGKTTAWYFGHAT